MPTGIEEALVAAATAEGEALVAREFGQLRQRLIALTGGDPAVLAAVERTAERLMQMPNTLITRVAKPVAPQVASDDTLLDARARKGAGAVNIDLDEDGPPTERNPPRTPPEAA